MCGHIFISKDDLSIQIMQAINSILPAVQIKLDKLREWESLGRNPIVQAGLTAP